ncbi:MAG: hypothetical protein NZ954_04260 [Thermofilaceae archaeon]|nr:hypothetical protein [Thermofilaceae archaeon]MCX8180044.1 hypothetical protein [Thermofilaceae archaeon]MDW8003213.1 hypothetical protein [Thermofilaceae archaeon]
MRIRRRLTLTFLTVCSILASAFLWSSLTRDSERKYTLVHFYVPWDDGAETATSVRYWLTERGRTVERVTLGAQGHFHVNGKRIRFFGVNIGGGACFPDKAEAEKIAVRLAKLGVNLVRLHGIDANWESINVFGGYDAPSTRKLDENALDRLDYFIAKLKEQGIYVNLNLLVARRFKAADGLHADVEKMDWKDQHALIFIDPKVKALYKEFAYNLLNRKNSYTNISYSEDPVVAFVEIANEMGAWFWYMLADVASRLPSYYRQIFENLWNDYLTSKYGSIDEYLRRWGVNANRAPILTGRTYWSAPDFVREDWLDFIYQLELGTYSELYNFLRHEVGYRGIIVGSTTFFSPLSIQSNFDVIDAHAYWQHPEFPGSSWDPGNWYVVNEPMVNQPLKSTIAYLAPQRVYGKPFVVSEYGHPAPNMFASEGIVMLAAYAALQDWDGIIYFSYGSFNDWDSRRIRGWFDIDQDPGKMALMIPAYMLFARGDVRPARTYVVANLSRDVERVRLKGYDYGEGSDVGIKPEISLIHRVAVATVLPPPEEAVSPREVTLPEHVNRNLYKSDTSQISWKVLEKGLGEFTVATERSIVLVGYVGERVFDFGNVELEVGDTLLGGYGIVSLVTKEDETFDSWSRMLLITIGYVTNEGMVVRNYDGRGVIAVGSTLMRHLGEARGKRVFCPFQWGQRGDWGSGPTIVEPLPIRVKLKTSGSIEVWALDNTGRRVAQIPVTTEGHAKVFKVDPSFGTVWYEIIAQP